jgi:hypothetical protein
MATRKAKLDVDLMPDGRPARPTVPDPRKTSPRHLGQRLLPQVPSVAPSKIRHTAVPRGSR